MYAYIKANVECLILKILFYLPKNNPMYPPMLPIRECKSTDFSCVTVLVVLGYVIYKLRGLGFFDSAVLPNLSNENTMLDIPSHGTG